jgi:hypothetical protein
MMDAASRNVGCNGSAKASRAIPPAISASAVRIQAR